MGQGEVTVERVREWRELLGARLTAFDGSLLPKIMAAFVAVLALTSLVTLTFETRLSRQQIQRQTVALIGETGDVLDARIASDAIRTNQLMSVVSQGLFGDSPGQGAVGGLDDQDRRTLSVVRTSDAQLDILGVIDIVSGDSDTLGLPTRVTFAPVEPDEALAVLRVPGSSQRVVPLTDGGFAVAYVLPIGRLGERPRLVATGYALDQASARRFLGQTRVDDVELVVDGAVVAASSANGTTDPVGDWRRTRATQRTDDGRLVRYVALGADRAWDTPSAVGLISEDPLAALDGALARTRLSMVAFLLVVGGALAYGLARVMIRPIVTLTETATAIAAGDLEREFDVVRGDEIGRLADALERMRRGLRAQLLVIGRQADALQESARRIVRVQDDERERVAQDLHDGIQQQLVVLRMQVGVGRAKLLAHPDQVEAVTEQLAGSIDRLLDQLRTTGQELFPSILRDRGLGPAVWSLAGRAEVPLVVTLEPDPLPRMDAEVEINAYFLLSEAVLNVLKHAEATRIAIHVAVEDGSLRVSAEDDGVGFEPPRAPRRGGLVHMRDRVNALRGSVQLVSRPGEGTRVEAVFPLPADGSVPRALQIEQDGGDTPIELDLLTQTELAEDGVGVLFDGAIRDRQLPRDGGVSSS
jgi:signal transduction histidine kinase